MDIVMPTIDEDGDLVTSSSPGQTRGGVHPVTGFIIRNCICSKPICRQLMWTLASINEGEYFPYLRLPNKPKESENSTPTKDHIKALRKNHFHHLHGYGEEGKAMKNALDEKEELFVALLHYPKKIRECIQASPQSLRKQYKFRVPLAVGKECGLTDIDLCPTTNENDERTYFISPIRRNVSVGSPVWNEVAVLVRNHNNNNKPATTEGNTASASAVQSRGPRATPGERKIERLTRLVESMSAEEVAKLLNDRDNRIETLEQQLSEEKNNSKKDRDAALKELENANDLLLKELATNGMSRKSLCNDDFYKKRPDLALHLYGTSWEEHKEIANAFFGEHDEDITDLKEKGWSTNVTGEGKMTPFEKFNICVMIAKQGFKEETVAAFYGRDQSRINRYKDEWMPKLEAAGAALSELDVEMNHNIFSVEMCESLGLPYMLDGQSIGLLDYLDEGDELRQTIEARHDADT